MVVAVCYGFLPMLGAVSNRYKWRKFRKRFIELGLSPLLDYRKYHQHENDGENFHFSGEIESITDGFTLWVRGKDLTIPVSLEKTKCFLLPRNNDDEIPEAPEQIRWNRVSTLNEGVKVYISGCVKLKNNRLNFISTKDNPLIIIFYNCPESELPEKIIISARTHNEYWNSLTPVSIGTGTLSLVYFAASFLNRPAFRVTVISALVAIFIPILPFIPPGLLFTNLFRRISWNARKLRAYRDLARFNLLTLGADKENNKNHVRSYAIRAYALETLAWVLMLFGISVNIVFIFLILFLFNVISFQ